MSSQETLFEASTQQELLEARARIKDDVLRQVIGTWEGRHVLFDIIGRGDLYDQDGTMAFESERVQRALGRREIALEVLKEVLRLDPQCYILMQQESGAFEAQFMKETGSEESDDE